MATRPDRAARNPVQPVDLILRVSTRWKNGDRTLEYRLHSPSRAVQGIPGTHHSKPLGAPEAFHRDLLAELEKLRDGVGVQGTTLVREEVHDTLTDIGRWLYRRLFPKSLRKAYRDFRDQARTLLLISDEAWIPWEIIRPDEDSDDDFFCVRFEMSRWLAEANEPVGAKGVRRVLCLTVGIREGQVALAETGAESEILGNLVKGFPAANCLVLEGPAVSDFQSHLAAGVDLVHFVGHGLHTTASVLDGADSRPELAQIDLADRPFRARELGGDVAARLRQDRPIVFFNSCESGRLDRALTGLGGWAQTWVEDCGASAFLAPFLSVKDTTARELAAVFYGELRQGRTLGSALRTARRAIRNAEKKDDKVAWLAYRLYGHPNLRLDLGSETLETVSIPLVESPLKLPEPRWDPDRSPPGALLRAEYGVVPFHFRKSEIEDLENWCRTDDNLGIRLYTGAGGMGKTRLALELCQRLRSAGWQAGLVDHERPAEETWRDLVEIGGPRLLIVDYAETRRPLLIPLLREINETDDDAPIRVLLLARAALDWWEQLKAEGEGVGELLSGPATRWHTLQPLAFAVEDRAESYQIAAAAFADQLKKDVVDEPPDDLDAEHYKRALLLHMSALAAIEGVDVKGEDGILDFVLNRERRFWQKHAVERELHKGVATGIGRAMAAITLGGGVDGEEQAVLAMRGLNFFRDEKENVLISVARLLSETYPGENHWIDPVMPDLLGEHLIMREMEVDSDELLDLVLGPRESDRNESVGL